MADILSQEEIDALLEVVDDDEEIKIDAAGYIKKLDELVNPLIVLERSELADILALLKAANEDVIPEFSEILANEFRYVIEGLTGTLPKINIIQGYTLNELRKEKGKNILVVSHKAEHGSFHFITDQNLASNLSDLMLGGEGDYKGDTIADSDDIDAMKEIISNIMGAIFTELMQRKAEVKSLNTIEKHKRVTTFVSTLGVDDKGESPLDDAVMFGYSLLSFIFTLNDINTRIDVLFPKEYTQLSLL